jgi:predicted nucleic acid-binding protein
MITAIDTNILIEYRQAGSERNAQALALLQAASISGPLIICEVVYVELAAAYPDPDHLDGFLVDLDISLWRTGVSALAEAGRSWRAYTQRRPRRFVCPQCGAEQQARCSGCGREIATRQHVAGDFMVGAHALAYADRLLSRDRGVYQTYFPSLNVIY